MRYSTVLLKNMNAFQALVGSFAATLHAGTAGSILGTATNWEELEIQEETESGNSVMSKIRLPVQVIVTIVLVITSINT